MKKQTFNPDKFFWGFHAATRYIDEPVTDKAGDRSLMVQTYDIETADAIKTIITRCFDVTVIMSNTIDQTEFIIKY